MDFVGEIENSGTHRDQKPEAVVTEVESGDVENFGDENGSRTPDGAVGSLSSPKSENLETSDWSTMPVMATKGCGLKKWRRIRREASKEGTGSSDSALVLKRRLPAAVPANSQADNKQKSDSIGDSLLVGSLSEQSIAVSVASGDVGAWSLGAELELLVANKGLSIGADSDNSEDQCSKSSTKASAPRLRHEMGFGRDRSRPKNAGWSGSWHAASQQRAQRMRSFTVDASGKSGGQKSRFEKENSHSSVESDLRSSNAIFRRQDSTVGNGVHGEGALNYDGEHSDEGQGSDEVKSGYSKKIGNIDYLDPDVGEQDIGEGDNSTPQSGIDPLVESMKLLQAAQEALQTEVQKLEGIARDPLPRDYSHCQLDEKDESSSPCFDPCHVELNCKIDLLERKLEEASAIIKAKDSKVLDLETILTSKLQMERLESFGVESLKDNYRAMEAELECLLQKKFEAEIEYLTIRRTVQSWKILTDNLADLFKSQRSLADDLIIKLRDLEKSVVTQKERMETLQASCKQLITTKEALKRQNGVCKASILCFIQLLLFLALCLFIIQIFPSPTGIVPT